MTNADGSVCSNLDSWPLTLSHDTALPPLFISSGAAIVLVQRQIWHVWFHSALSLAWRSIDVAHLASFYWLQLQMEYVYMPQAQR